MGSPGLLRNPAGDGLGVHRPIAGRSVIPLVSPTYSHEDREAVQEAAIHLDQGEEYVARLEERLARMFGAVGAVCTTSGTAALHLALMAVIPQGTPWHVTLPTYSCVALLHASLMPNGNIDLIDCETPDPERMYYGAEFATINPDLFGTVSHRPANIRDWAQSLGGDLKLIHPHTCAVLSFHESKMVSGQHGGAVVTNDPDLLARLRDLNGYAEACVADRFNDRPTYVQRVNYRMGGLSAALVLSQLQRLPDFVARRRHIATFYNDALKGCPAILPTNVPEGSVFGRYVVALEKMHPVAAIQAMAERGVECGRGVWPPLHRLMGLPPASFPNAEKAGATVFSLPIWPGLQDSEVEMIAEQTRCVLSQ